MRSGDSGGPLRTAALNCAELIYDWNKIYAESLRPAGPVLLDDETLRDGLQSPSVRDPSIAEKLEILHLMEVLGINMADIGLPGAGQRAYEDALAIASEIGNSRLKLVRLFSPRAGERHPSDCRIQQKTAWRWKWPCSWAPAPSGVTPKTGALTFCCAPQGARGEVCPHA